MGLWSQAAVPQFPHLYNGHSTCVIGVLQSLNEPEVKVPELCQAHSRCSECYAGLFLGMCSNGGGAQLRLLVCGSKSCP